jgi:pSer/pThr/pTyr-binding forkhead associated (FHA) protein
VPAGTRRCAERCQYLQADTLGRRREVTLENNDERVARLPRDDTYAFEAPGVDDAHGLSEIGNDAGGVAETPDGSALLVVKRGPNTGTRYHLDRAITSAGRHFESDIFLDDVSVSRRHAEFHRLGDTVRVVDAGSLSGTYVNRRAIDSVVLHNNDEILIGKFRLVFCAGKRSRDR